MSPSDAALHAAAAFARSRPGRVAWAVIDTDGRLHGRALDRHYRAASVTKAMLLVAWTRSHRVIDRPTRALLAAMVRRSSNEAASRIYRAAGGDAALAAVGGAAGMRCLELRGAWSEAGITAADQASFLHHLHALVPRRHRAFARRLLKTIVPEQRWGVPVAADGLRVLFKGGWRRRLVHQVARVEDAAGRHVTIAVLTDDNPSFDVGVATIEGIARRLLHDTIPGRRLVRFREGVGR